MVKLAKYLKSSAGFVALIVGLLFLQAYCDLELPDYTSRIVNEGIQQSGIEDGVPEKMREQTAQSLELFLDEDARQLLEKSYAQEDGRYVLKDLSDKERKELGTVLEKAELVTGVLMQMDGQEAAAMMQGANAPDMGNMPAENVSAPDMGNVPAVSYTHLPEVKAEL